MAKKKNRRRTRAARVPLYVYADDSGNSGLNLFDEQQPYYWTAALLSPVDIQAVGLKDHKRWTSQLNVSELHGALLGVDGIEQIAIEMRDFFKKHGCRFVFSMVEKRYLAGTMLAQLVLTLSTTA